MKYADIIKQRREEHDDDNIHEWYKNKLDDDLKKGLERSKNSAYELYIEAIKRIKEPNINIKLKEVLLRGIKRYEDEYGKPNNNNSSKQPESEPSKLTKKQESAIKKLDKLKGDKIISSSEYKKAKSYINKNQSINIYEDILIFKFTGSKKAGAGINIKVGKGLNSDSSSSEESEEEEDKSIVINFDKLLIDEDEFKTSKPEDLLFRYNMMKSAYEGYTGKELPEIPEQKYEETNSNYKTKFKRLYKKILSNNPDIKDIMEDMGSTKDMNFNGNGIKGGTLSPDDLIELRQMFNDIEKSKPKTNLFSNIKPTDLTDFYRKTEQAKEGLLGQKQSLEYARRAVAERLKEKQPKQDMRFINRPTSIDDANEKLRKAINKTKPKITKTIKKKKSLISMAEKMAKLREMKKSKK